MILRNSVLLEKLKITYLVKKFPVSQGTQRFITVLLVLTVSQLL